MDQTDYFAELAKIEQENEPSMIAYAYQQLGLYYLYDDNISKAAEAYSLSLNKYPLNQELTHYLNKLGVVHFSKPEIEEGLKKITH
jgi:hypothetical protein